MATLKSVFTKFKKPKGTSASVTLMNAGWHAKQTLGQLLETCDRVPMDWKGKGKKSYTVFTNKGQKQPFSRAANSALFIPDVKKFEQAWTTLTAAIAKGALSKTAVCACKPEIIDSAIYTAVIAYASAIDIAFNGDRGGPGNFFETIVGAIISELTGLPENGHVQIDMPTEPTKVVVKSDGKDVDSDDDNEPVVEEGAGTVEDKAVISTDRWFKGKKNNLIVALKISSRERISQVSVQQLILERLQPGGFRSILCACNENNIMAPKGTEQERRPYDVCCLKDTLVPKTIALYEKFISPFAGLYYLDPPTPYMDGTYKGLPPVKRLSELLTADLPILLGLDLKSKG